MSGAWRVRWWWGVAVCLVLAACADEAALYLGGTMSFEHASHQTAEAA